MQRVFLFCTVSIALATFLGACVAPKRASILPTTSVRHIIFNPEWSRVPSLAVGRSDWPSSIAFSEFGEVIDYRETIRDRQGQFGANRDRYSRRFDSVREGRARR